MLWLLFKISAVFILYLRGYEIRDLLASSRDRVGVGTREGSCPKKINILLYVAGYALQ